MTWFAILLKTVFNVRKHLVADPLVTVTVVVMREPFMQNINLL